MTSSLPMIRGRSNVVTLTNKSGGALVAGDVCIIDTSNDEAATTTTSSASLLKVYIAAESIANDATGKFYSSGFCPLVTPSASVTRGRYLFTHTVAKQAAENATYGAGAFGVILKSGTTPSVWLFGTTAQGSGGGVGGTTGSTDNAVLRADGTGGSTIQSSLATIDDSGTVNIPTGQTYNINSTPHTHTPATAMVQIAQVAVGAGGAASIDFTSIPGTYTNLMLTGLVRGEKAATLITPYLRFNADGNANYDRQYLEAFGTGTSSSGVNGGTSLGIGNLPGGNSPANYFGFLQIEIPCYANTTTYKAAFSRFSEARSQSDTNYGVGMVSGFWRSTAAITQVTLTPDSGEWAQYSIVTLYGLT